MPGLIILLSLGIMFLSNSYIYGFPSKDQNCSKCHSLTIEEAKTMLKGFDQNIKVLNVNKSSVKYLWEISYESKGKKGIVYVDLPKKHLFSGSLIAIQGKRNLTQERFSEINKVSVSQIPLKDALVIGHVKARHKVIVFDDPE